MQKNLITEIDTRYFIFSKTGLEIKQGTPIDKWIECGKFLKKVEGATQWWVGDWINFGEKEYGEMYSQALDETEYSYGTLRNIACVARNVELSRRHDNVDFSKYQEIAFLTPKEQDKWIEKLEEEKLSQKQLRTAIKRSKLVLPKLKGKSNVNLKCGDFRECIKEIKKNSVSLIITDPPYTEEYLPLWSDLAEEAVRILKPGGFLVAYSGQVHLMEILKRLSKHLDYYWLMGLYHKGNIGQRFEVNMWNRFKPILVFQKPPKTKQNNWIEDIVVSEHQDKDKHEWGQSVEPFVKLIETFSQEGDIICDPFFGGGATIEASVKTKRHIFGYEIDKDYFNLVNDRYV